MTSRERIEMALAHQEADRVPYDLGGTTVTTITKNAYIRAMNYRGLSAEIGTDTIDPIQQIVTPTRENLESLASDTRRVGAERIFNFEQNVRVKGDIKEVTDLYGCQWQFDSQKDLYFNMISSTLEPYELLSDSIGKLAPIPWDSYIPELRKQLDQQIQEVGDHAGVADRNTAGLTENSLRIRGYEKWFMDTAIDPAGVESLLDRIIEDKITYWDAVADWAYDTGNEMRIQVTSECDDLGSQSSTILDPSMLRQMVIPRLKTLFSHIKKRLPHTKMFLHSCGAIRELLPDLVEAGLDILNPVQFTAAGMNLKDLKKDFGDVLTFWGGGVDTQSTLNNGNAQAVRDQVREIIDILAPGGGFVFAPVHNVQDDVPPENFWAMWDTLMEYGKY